MNCPGCGAFYIKECRYCSYIATSWDEAATEKFTTLKIIGDMNIIKVKYGEPKNDVVVVKGDMQKLEIQAKILNVAVYGDMNKVHINKKIAYAPIVKGDMNRIK